MRYFVDFEFLEDGKTIEPMSVGIVADDGREYYAQFIMPDDFDRRLTPWLRQNVLPHMTIDRWFTREQVKADVLAFCDPEKYGQPEFWGYYADYDWVALCQLFGTMMDLPQGWPMYCRDLRQWADQLGITGDLDGYIDASGEHHALADAYFNAAAYDFLAERAATRGLP